MTTGSSDKMGFFTLGRQAAAVRASDFSIPKYLFLSDSPHWLDDVMCCAFKETCLCSTSEMDIWILLVQLQSPALEKSGG